MTVNTIYFLSYENNQLSFPNQLVVICFNFRATPTVGGHESQPNSMDVADSLPHQSEGEFNKLI